MIPTPNKLPLLYVQLFFSNTAKMNEFCANDPVNNTDPTGMIVEFIGDNPEKEEKLRTNIDFLRSNSPIFNDIYNNLESLSDIFTVGFGITSETGDGENARGEYRAGEKQ